MEISLITTREMTRITALVSCGGLIKCAGSCFTLDDMNTVLVINGEEWWWWCERWGWKWEEETWQRRQISFSPMLGTRSERAGGKKRMRHTSELIAVPAAKCGHICFVECKAKKKRLHDYNAITFWLEILDGTAKEAVFLSTAGLITAIEENKKKDLAQVRKLSFVQLFLLMVHFEDSQNPRGGQKPHHNLIPQKTDVLRTCGSWELATWGSYC